MMPTYIQRGPTISNRDMGELMARDDAFSRAVWHNGANFSSPGEGDEATIFVSSRSSDGARLQCRMQVCSMSDNRGAYEAISYTWMTGREEFIECNGKEVMVGANLYLALRRVRRDRSKRTVWADALCIDQSNALERSQQVAAMGKIFRNAYSVLVASSKAFDGVCSVVSTWAGASTSAAAHRMLEEGPQYRIQEAGTCSGSMGDLSAESKVWLEVLHLYKRRWFSRLWVVQEIALARRATAIWGACEMSWEWIGLAASIIRTNWDRFVPGCHKSHSDESSRLVPVGVMNAYFMYRISRLQSYVDPLCFSFGELLTLTRQFKCEDDRDKIFGLLGLPTTDQVNSYITPDYGQSLADGYRSLASAMLCSTKSLAFLSHVHRWDITDDTESGSALPSWIPKWHLVGPQTLTPLDAHPDFAAGLSKAAKFRVAHDQAGHPDRLAVCGVMLEDVKEPSKPQRPVTRSARSPFVRWTGGIEDLEMVLARHPHTKRSLEKLAITLTAGKSWYGLPKDRDGMLADFDHCLIAGYLWWALEPDAFGLTNGTRATTAVSETSSAGGDGNLFLDAVATACVGRQLFRTASNMRGVGPFDTRLGDKVRVIYGCPVPFVIWRCQEKGGYTLVGECYIDDIMHWEAVDDEKYEEVWIDLV
ncbi:heterokaryon incompatibility protein-domain-containing protein [Chaetomium strumarium]|uniref:Heterokaryon incompatibility protein-domain-containing protein n=1 Tax=Chaetomium strumarium TaxID=1170767 RepID=A0AAJ0LZ99_9PEZI|nr:heterokaryon incompatibility protein-domain-containing protein [Chaetomium strumarium]